ncbi:hypothetical protein [Kitasatospora camelliae]|uniref:Uncharacterized protein n=1 Tax=Kitasatospora camelliae TaxID=3156397 RepID=A0AAU8JVD5_9ACTN
MHEQPSGLPAQAPNGAVPPPPPLPPAYGPPPHAYGPPAAGWNQPAPARPSRTGLWIALGVVGAIVLAGTAFAVTRPGGTAQPATAPARGAAAPAADGAGAAAGAGSGEQAPGAGNATMGRLHLPDTFLGMKRDDNAPGAAVMRQRAEAMAQDDPHLRVVATTYKSGQFGENHVEVIAVESDVPFSEKDRAEALADMNDGSVDVPGMKVTHGEVKDADPGPLGGVMKCKVTITKTESTDSFGNHLFTATTCAWLDGNTYVTIADGDGTIGLAKAADHARQFRARAESRR